MDKSLILKKIQEAYMFVTKTQFAEHLGVKPQTISSWYSRNTFDHDLLYEKLKDLNPLFLFTGEGSVKINSQTHFISKSEQEKFENDHDQASLDLKNKNSHEVQDVPLFDVHSVTGAIPIADHDQLYTPIDHIYIPNLPRCDGAVSISGDSMYPLLKSGDIIMYKSIEDLENNIFWGEMYLIAVQSGSDNSLMVKFIQKSERGDKYVKLVSHNQQYQTKDFKISKISALAMVKASVRIKTMS